MALAADAGDPVHLTAWDLRRVELQARTSCWCARTRACWRPWRNGTAARVAAVCTSGQPALVVLDVLHALAGARLRYHGDFDWPGIAIANRLVAEVGVVPWRMGADQYLAALHGPRVPLLGTPVEPVWDRELGAAMRHHGVAVHEEAVLDDLLAAVTTA